MKTKSEDIQEAFSKIEVNVPSSNSAEETAEAVRYRISNSPPSSLEGSIVVDRDGNVVPDPLSTLEYNPFQFTKREYIAIMAMQGLLSKDVSYGKNVLVKIAVETADLLLKELEIKP